ncbi:PIP5K7 [Symbiodinium sp. CCMP2592]|nr:PIP5K7 [Symbiodinium sp. CCMP2592]
MLLPKMARFAGGIRGRATQAATLRRHGLPFIRTFASTPGKEEKKVPPETPEQVTLKLKEQKDYWNNQERSTVKTILSQWGGLLFFGFWCLVVWIGKKWSEWEMHQIERELEEPRKRRRRQTSEE